MGEKFCRVEIPHAVFGAAEAQAFPSAHSARQAFLAEEQKGHLEAAIPQITRGTLANAHLPKPNL